MGIWGAGEAGRNHETPNAHLWARALDSYRMGCVLDLITGVLALGGSVLQEIGIFSVERRQSDKTRGKTKENKGGGGKSTTKLHRWNQTRAQRHIVEKRYCGSSLNGFSNIGESLQRFNGKSTRHNTTESNIARRIFVMEYVMRTIGRVPHKALDV